MLKTPENNDIANHAEIDYNLALRFMAGIAQLVEQLICNQ
ncbi:MAG: hypothetical protein RJA83_141 [Pseudomonadota bacterium]